MAGGCGAGAASTCLTLMRPSCSSKPSSRRALWGDSASNSPTSSSSGMPAETQHALIWMISQLKRNAEQSLSGMSTVYVMPSRTYQTLPSQDLIAAVMSLHRNGLHAIQMTHMHGDSLLDGRILILYTEVVT